MQSKLFPWMYEIILHFMMRFDTILFFHNVNEIYEALILFGDWWFILKKNV